MKPPMKKFFASIICSLACLGVSFTADAKTGIFYKKLVSRFEWKAGPNGKRQLEKNAVDNPSEAATSCLNKQLAAVRDAFLDPAGVPSTHLLALDMIDVRLTDNTGHRVNDEGLKIGPIFSYKNKMLIRGVLSSSGECKVASAESLLAGLAQRLTEKHLALVKGSQEVEKPAAPKIEKVEDAPVLAKHVAAPPAKTEDIDLDNLPAPKPRKPATDDELNRLIDQATKHTDEQDVE